MVKCELILSIIPVACYGAVECYGNIEYPSSATSNALNFLGLYERILFHEIDDNHNEEPWDY